MKLNGMGTMTAKQLRKEVVDNIENCENFANVFAMIFKSDHTKLAEFKKKHHREGEFTDEDGVMTLATGYYLGGTLRIFSRTNTRKQPYTEHNENQPIIFNIFLDDRTSGHFQSLLQPKTSNIDSEDLEPERTSDEAMQDFYDRFLNVEQEIYKPLKQIIVGRLENSKKINGPTGKIDLEENKVKQTMIKEEKIKKSNVIENKKVTPEMPKKPTTPQEKDDKFKETSVPKEENIIQQSIRQEGTKIDYEQPAEIKNQMRKIRKNIIKPRKKGQIHMQK
jgi:hypothetical protein